MTTIMVTREAIVAAARSWLGTPYHHQASCKGVGSDCLGLIRGIWRELYGPEPEAMPAYTRDWGSATGSETLLEAACRHLIKIEDMSGRAPGDVLVFRMRDEGVAKHVGILTRASRLVHAQEGLGVIEIELGRWWRRRAVAAFSFPGVSTLNWRAAATPTCSPHRGGGGSVMATLVLGAVGSAIGGALISGGLSLFGAAITGAAIGSAVGSVAGGFVDQALLGPLAGSSGQTGIAQGPRLFDLKLGASSEGAVLAARLWPRAPARTAHLGHALQGKGPCHDQTTGGGQASGGKNVSGSQGAAQGGKVKSEEYRYFANVAYAICEGPITRVGRIWADGKDSTSRTTRSGSIAATRRRTPTG